MSYSWNSNGTTNNKKLQPWLDPTNSGVSSFRGDDYSTLSNTLVETIQETYSTIYPNPAKDEINISLSILQNSTQVEIFDEVGRVVLRDIIPANTTSYSINASNLKVGYYIIKYISQEKIWTNKLIVE